MLNWINRKMKRKGFTLIEMVIVIAILGILIAIAVPRLAGFRDTAQDAADEASIETITKAVELYRATYDEDDEPTIEQLVKDHELLDEDASRFEIIYNEDGTFTVGVEDEK
ncbi:MAG: prepilin-type N-terminal cleavage/methylation domain-containing protein [Tissierellia bacterium]|nr:prepilin-type N-terminal cleavage/methylation domain-containing protein [Tissierellia bacterium]